MWTIARSVIVGLVSWPGLGLLAPPLAQGQTPRVLTEEVRHFDILVKNEPAGTSLIKITESDDGRTVVSTNAAVTFNLLVYIYRYEFHGKETWQGNRLAWVDNRATDGGKTLALRAHVDSRGSIIEAHGEARRKGPVLEMTTNYWRLPDSLQGGTFSLVDADRGTVHQVTIEHVGPDEVTVGGRKVACSHYRLRGSLAAELWFDGKNRLVRQRTVEDGYPTELRLTRLTTNTPLTARR